jgi:ubiquinone/menaquinone biosynthesis C-methylase UbiE
MKRTLEPELMEKLEQASAYARADFHEPHERFVRLFEEKIGEVAGRVLDLGCGPADVTIRFAQNNPDCMIFGVDGSRAMLLEAQNTLARAPDVKGRIILINDMLSGLGLPQRSFDVIISNSLLHHLHKPHYLWNALKLFAQANAWVFVMELFRPANKKKAHEIVEAYAKDEPETLRNDFFNSLCAAFEPEEIKEQLKEAGLEHLAVQLVSDRHVLIFGRM